MIDANWSNFSSFSTGSLASRKHKCKKNKSDRLSSMSKRWRSARLSTKCNSSCSAINKSSLKKRRWGRSAGKQMKKAWLVKKIWRGRPSSMSTNLKLQWSSNSWISRSNMLSSLPCSARLLTWKWYIKKLVSAERPNARRSSLELVWLGSRCQASSRIPSWLPKLPILVSLSSRHTLVLASLSDTWACAWWRALESRSLCARHLNCIQTTT